MLRLPLGVFDLSTSSGGTEFLCWILGSALVKGSNYFRALSISICCPYLRRPGLRWLEFQVINVSCDIPLRGVLFARCPPPPLSSSSSSQRARQAGRDKGLSSTWAILFVSCCMGFPCPACCRFPGLEGWSWAAEGCIAEV